MEFMAVKRMHGYAAVVERDDCSGVNPRDDFDNLGKMYIDGSRYLRRRECDSSQVGDAVLRVPLSTREEGEVGCIVAFRGDILKEYGRKRLSKRILGLARRVLEGEVDDFNRYLNGDVYGWRVYKVDDDVAEGDIESEGKELDSCWGYFCEVDEVMQDALEAIPEEARTELSTEDEVGA